LQHGQTKQAAEDRKEGGKESEENQSKGPRSDILTEPSFSS
jgi:hypothetical protein